MAQSLSNFSHTLSFAKSSNTFCGHCLYRAKTPELRLTRPNFTGVKSMKADRRDNGDHSHRPGLKRREAVSAPVGLWERFPTARTVQQMLETMERMVDEPFVFNSGWPSPLPNDGGGYVRGRTPWEIKEGDVEYKMRFDMPGMTRDDVKVWVEDKMLIIKAEKMRKRKDGQEIGEMENDGDWFAKSYGRYSSRIALPENVEFEKIRAEVKDGVLYIMIPKASSNSKIFSIYVE